MCQKLHATCWEELSGDAKRTEIHTESWLSTGLITLRKKHNLMYWLYVLAKQRLKICAL